MIFETFCSTTVGMSSAMQACFCVVIGVFSSFHKQLHLAATCLPLGVALQSAMRTSDGSFRQLVGPSQRTRLRASLF